MCRRFLQGAAATQGSTAKDAKDDHTCGGVQKDTGIGILNGMSCVVSQATMSSFAGFASFAVEVVRVRVPECRAEEFAK